MFFLFLFLSIIVLFLIAASVVLANMLLNADENDEIWVVTDGVRGMTRKDWIEMRDNGELAQMFKKDILVLSILEVVFLIFCSFF